METKIVDTNKILNVAVTAVMAIIVVVAVLNGLTALVAAFIAIWFVSGFAL